MCGTSAAALMLAPGTGEAGAVSQRSHSWNLRQAYDSFGWHRFRFGSAEYRVARARDAVLVGPADDLRDLVEVEDRRRRAHLPLERERVPRVRLRDGPVLPRP